MILCTDENFEFDSLLDEDDDNSTNETIDESKLEKEQNELDNIFETTIKEFYETDQYQELMERYNKVKPYIDYGDKETLSYKLKNVEYELSDNYCEYYALLRDNTEYLAYKKIHVDKDYEDSNYEKHFKIQLESIDKEFLLILKKYRTKLECVFDLITVRAM